MGNPRAYYEEYWRNPSEAIPTKDPTTPQRLQLLHRYLADLRSGARILDAGCGDGFFLNEIEKFGCTAFGLDITLQPLAEAKKQGRRGGMICTSVESVLPLADASLDVIFSTEVIEHLFDVTRFLAEADRVLRSNGKLILTTPFHGLIKNLSIALFDFDRHFDVAGPHIRFFTLKALSRLLKKHGFRVDRIHYVGRFWPLSKTMFVVASKV